MTAATDVSLLAAFTGGVLSFASPCVLPLVPAYLSVITGLGTATIRDGGRSRAGRVLATAGGFVAGFTVVFVTLGLSVTAVGQALSANRVPITRVSGLVVLAMALFLAGSLVLRAPWLYQEKRWHPVLDRFGPLAAPVAGVAFGFGWTPCIGPVLTSVLALAAASGEAAHGGVLLLAYSAGLGVPFLVAALALDRVSGALGPVKRHLTALTAGSAAVLGTFGVLLALNRMQLVTTLAQNALSTAGLGDLLRLG
jgi:cytochrome c-type biogenesis protein